MSAPFIAPEYPVFPPAALSYPSGKQYWDADQMLNYAREHGLNCGRAALDVTPPQCINCGGTKFPHPLDLDWRGRCECVASTPAVPDSSDGLMVDIVPPATSRDRWMYEQGRLAERRVGTPPAASGSAEPVATLSTEEHDEIGISLLPASLSLVPGVYALYAGAPPSQQANAISILAAKHTGMRVDYRGLLRQSREALRRDPALAEMLLQLQGHLTELGTRWYTGDMAAVDEFLQLYCIESEAREVAAISTPASVSAKDAERKPLNKMQLDEIWSQINAEVARMESDRQYTFAGWYPVAVRLIEAAHGITPAASKGAA